MGEEAIGRRPTSNVTSKATYQAYVSVYTDIVAIAHAVFWDGTLFRDSPSVDRDPGLARLHIGLHQSYGPVALDISYIVQTVPYENPDDNDLEGYGRISLAFGY